MREGTVERRLATHAHPNGIAPARAACTSPRAHRAGSAPGSARRRIVVGPGLLRTWRGGSRPGRTRDLGCAPERSIVDAYRLRHLEGDELGREALKAWLRQHGSQPSRLRTIAVERRAEPVGNIGPEVLNQMREILADLLEL